MREIGGYFELEKYTGEQYYKKAIYLNCGRGCIKYLIELRNIRKIWIPNYICDSVRNAFIQTGAKVMEYKVTESLLPNYNFSIERDEWLYLCDFYGQLQYPDIEHAKKISRGNLICDETQGFFKEPYAGVDTFYSCRKWFGVPDGGVLITSDGKRIDRRLTIDRSKDRMTFVLGRFEESASEYFGEASDNNNYFDYEPVRLMSKITDNLLRGIDYEHVIEQRISNWRILEQELGEINLITPLNPKVPFMYPLLLDDTGGIRKALAGDKIYVPTLWSDVFERVSEGDVAYKYSKNILPLPCDQRYNLNDMERMIYKLKQILRR